MNNDDKLIKFFNESLTELEKDSIEAFCKNDVMHGAVQKVLLQGLYLQGTIQKGYEVDPLQNGAFGIASQAFNNPIPDAEIGASVRAQFAGLNYLKNAFDSLNMIKVKKEAVLSDYNEAM